MTQTDCSDCDPRAFGAPASLRIVPILLGDDFTGPAGQVASTAIELARRGADLRFVLLCRPGQRTGRMQAFLERRGIPSAVLTDRGRFDVRLLTDLRRLLDEWRPAIVETHGYKATALALVLSRFRRPWCWIGFFHGLTAESRRAVLYHALDLRMLGRADRAVAVTEHQRRALSRWAPEAAVVTSAVPQLDLQPTAGADAAILEELESAVRPRIAVIGRLSSEKGVDVALRAAAILAEERSFSLIVAGEGPELGALKRLTASLRITDRVRFLGQVRCMPLLYQHIELLAIPSRSEGLPSVLLEALAADVPVVATRVGSIPDVLVSPATGVLVPPDSPVQLADGIRRALAFEGTAEARDARATAARLFSQERRATDLLALYHGVLARTRRSVQDPDTAA